MEAFLNNLSNFIETVVEFVSSGIQYFLRLFEDLKTSVVFVYECISYIPSAVRNVAVILLTIMIAKFVLSMGKQ